MTRFLESSGISLAYITAQVYTSLGDPRATPPSPISHTNVSFQKAATVQCQRLLQRLHLVSVLGNTPFRSA